MISVFGENNAGATHGRVHAAGSIILTRAPRSPAPRAPQSPAARRRPARYFPSAFATSSSALAPVSRTLSYMRCMRRTSSAFSLPS